MIRSLLLVVLSAVPSTSFSPLFASIASAGSPVTARRPTFLMSSADGIDTNLLSLTLEKPLGIILGEIEEGAPLGVKVEEIADSGSAYASEYKDVLPGLKVASVMGDDVTSISFDDVMAKIIDAPSPVTIAFEGAPSEKTAEPSEPQFDVGTPVTICVMQEGKPDVSIDAKVGDNLRLTLLENDVELYRGLKKKLGNCGGGGQCTFCAVDFVESEGWEARSEYEDGKIGKFPRARLACMNNIQGPATIRTR